MDSETIRRSMHQTTMAHAQRAILIRTLSECCALEALAGLTDAELYEQWLWCCAYVGGVNHVPEHAGQEETEAIADGR